MIVAEKPSLAQPISQACTASQLDEEVYAYWCEQIRESPRRHRKQWEFCYIAQALARHGALAPGRRGLGFGVGREPLVALFAARGAKILASDLDPETAARNGWIQTEQHAAGRDGLNQREICPADLFDRNVSFRCIDMTAIPADIGSFDFIWSSCALEHLGSIEEGHRFILQSSELLKPGGIAVHTTEFNYASDDDTLDHGETVLFRQKDFRAMGRALAAAGFEVTMNFNLGDMPLDRYVDVPPYSGDNHLKLQLGKWVTTSFGLLIKRP